MSPLTGTFDDRRDSALYTVEGGVFELQTYKYTPLTTFPATLLIYVPGEVDVEGAAAAAGGAAGRRGGA